MVIRATVGFLSLVLAFVVSTSCSSKGGGSSAEGGGVGAACTSDSECTGYSHPSCLTDLRPLQSLVAPDAGAEGNVFKTLDVPFPGGYCSNTLDNSCQSDADCGTGAGCYRPLTGVTPDVLSSLDKVVKVFSVTGFASKGLCLATCTSDSDCRTDQGYKCLTPLEGFISVVNPPYKNTYCAQFVDVTYLLVGGGPDGG